jgi:hypothetical protein
VRTSFFCLVPEALADELLMPLRAHYRCDPDVEVLVDLRTGEWQSETRAVDEQRGGRDRRRPAVPRNLAATLPPGLSARAAELRWEQRLRPVRRRLQDTPLDALLALIANGDDDANSELYWRYAHRVRARLASGRVHPRRLDTATRLAFGRLIDELVRADRVGRSFDAFVAAVADSVAADTRERATRSRLEP